MNNVCLDILEFKKNDIALFCGAGISMNSGLPSANELKKVILERLSIDKEDINDIMTSTFPFEAFMEILSDNFGINEILEMFKYGKPNSNHILIAKLAKYGYIKTIFTTNFDQLIEVALEKEGLKRETDYKIYISEDQFTDIENNNKNTEIINVFKIHGSIESVDSIRTTMQSISNKTHSLKRNNIVKYLFSTGNHKKVLILGYSCSDEFDITPQIQNISKTKKEILFLEHYNKIGITEDIKVQKFKNPFRTFNGLRIKCNTDIFIEEIWKSLEDIIGKYSYNKTSFDWRKHIITGTNEIYKKNDLKYYITGLLFFYISNYNKTIKYYKKAIVCLNKEKSVEFCEYNISLGVVYRQIGTLDKAIEHYNSSLKIVTELKLPKAISRVYELLGIAYHDKGDINQAIEFYEKSLLIAKEIKDYYRQIRCLKDIGVAHNDIGESKKAINYYRKSLKILSAIGAIDEEAEIYKYLGSTYSALGYHNKSIKYNQKALDIAVKIGNRSTESSCYLGIGDNFFQKKDYKKTIVSFNKSLKIALDINEKSIQTSCYLALGDVYMDLNELTKAIDNYKKAEVILAITKQNYKLEKVYKCLSKAYSYDKRLSVEYMKKLNEIMTN